MKNLKRAERRWKSKCKFEKRLKIWVQQGMYVVTHSGNYRSLGGHQLEKIRNEIRESEYWTFLKSTSTPCSCIMCSPEKYKRTLKHEVNKQIWKDIQDF